MGEKWIIILPIDSRGMSTSFDHLCRQSSTRQNRYINRKRRMFNEPGAIYSAVPTNELVLKSAMHIFVSTRGTPLGVINLIPAGAPPDSDCFERSKSESII